MPDPRSDPPAPRADKQRNRARLLAVAADAFAAEESPTLESIAQRAGFGIGTLYRHFSTREALVEAVYRAELDRLCDTTDELLAASPPEVALRVWMGRWSAFVATKRGMADAFQALAASGAVTKAETGQRLTAAIGSILAAGAAAGTLRDDVAAQDVTAALTGTLLVAGGADQQDQAARLLDLLMDGLTTTRP